ncbi:MAG TPA: hypothetical protein VGJ83_04445 [Gemmatimonadales bacterium]
MGVVGLALLAAPTRAQLCAGRAAFADGRAQVAGGADLEDFRTVVSEVAIGTARGYGQVSFGTIHVPELGGSALGLSVLAGSQVPMDRAGTWHFCPVGSVSIALGPNNLDVNGNGTVIIDAKEMHFVFSLNVGAIAARVGEVQLIPTGSLSGVAAHAWLKDQRGETTASTTEYFGVVDLGIGVLVQRVVSFRALASILLGLDGASTGYEISASVNFGKRLTPRP